MCVFAVGPPCVYLRPVAGMPSLLTVMLSRRILGLSYSSIDMPRDRRRAPKAALPPSFEPPELVEYARPRSMPGIQTDVNKPCPLQNNKIDCATFDGCRLQIKEQEHKKVKVKKGRKGKERINKCLCNSASQACRQSAAGSQPARSHVLLLVYLG